MLDLINLFTHLYSASLYNGYNTEGKEQVTCVIKARWNFDAAGKLTQQDTPAAIEETDRYVGEPGKSSLIAANEIMPFKEKSEISLYGTAYSSQGNSTQATVNIKIVRANSTWEKTLFVFGKRYWQATLFGYKPSKPEVLQPLALNYEHAYGSADFALNPLGKGFIPKRGAILNSPLPQIETASLIAKPTDRPSPAGFGAIPVTWQATSTAKAITPTNMAPPDQQFAQPFLGNEKIFLSGLMKNFSGKTVELRLPCLRPILKLFLNNQTQTLTPACDTVVINTDHLQLDLIWRMGISLEMSNESDGILLLCENF